MSGALASSPELAALSLLRRADPRPRASASPTRRSSPIASVSSRVPSSPGLVFGWRGRSSGKACRRGDCVALLATISPEALAARCAAALLGCATMFCPDKGSDAGLRGLLSQIGADALIVFPATAAAAAGATESGPVARVMSLGPVPGIDLDLLAVAETMADDPIPSRAQAGDLGVLVSSGGTTGEPKASRRSFAAYGRMVDVGRRATGGCWSACRSPTSRRCSPTRC